MKRPRFEVTELQGYDIGVRPHHGGPMGTSVQVVDHAFRRIVWGPHATETLVQRGNAGRRWTTRRERQERRELPYYASHEQARVALLAEADAYCYRLNEEYGEWPTS